MIVLTVEKYNKVHDQRGRFATSGGTSAGAASEHHDRVPASQEAIDDARKNSQASTSAASESA